MTTYTLRPARESESRVIKDLIRLVGINPMDLDWKRFVVAVNDRDEMIGCGQLKPHGREILELASIAIRPEHQKKGIGRMIVEHLLKVSPRPLYLTCRSRLEPFYEKFGFRAISYDEMPRYYQRISKLVVIIGAVARFGEGDGLSVMKLK